MAYFTLRSLRSPIRPALAGRRWRDSAAAVFDVDYTEAGTQVAPRSSPLTTSIGSYPTGQCCANVFSSVCEYGLHSRNPLHQKERAADERPIVDTERRLRDLWT